MTDDKYRNETPRPVCAKCKYRCDAKHMEKDQPWRDWFCLATSKEIFHEEYNPITGVTTPAKMGHDRCIDINPTGDCAMFEPGEDRPEPRTRPEPPPQTGAPEPIESDPAPSWWQRLLRGCR